MEFTDVDNVKEQIPVLIGNLNNRGSLSAFDVVQQVKLTLPAAIKYNMAKEVAGIKSALIVFLTNETSSGSYNPFLPILRLIDESRRAFTKDEKEAIYPLAFQRFTNEIKALQEKQDYSLHGIIELGKVLVKYYAKQQMFIETDSILNSIIDSIEESEPNMPAMRKVSIYRDLVPIVRDLGRKEPLERINKILQDNAPHIKDEMNLSSFKLSIPSDMIEKDFKAMSEGFTDEQFLFILALRFVPSESELKDYSDKIIKGSKSLSMFRHLYFRTDGNLSHEVNPDSEGSSAQFDQACSVALQYLGVALHVMIMKGEETGRLNVDSIMDFIARIPGLSEKRIRIIEKGIAAFLDNDYITSISILVPQVEYLVRLFFQTNGFTVTDNDKIGTTSDALGTLLSKEDIIVCEKNISNYLRLILSQKTGWNMRNLYCHGIEDSFSLTHADRVFHIVLLMAALMQPQDK